MASTPTDPQAALRRLTRAFYDQRGDAFADTRDRPWSGWDRVLDGLTPAARVLDLGCGHGRFAAYLQTRSASPPASYLGIDDSATMVARSGRRAWPAWVRFQQADVLSPTTWDHLARDDGFDLVAMFGLLHHIPSQSARCGLLDRGIGVLKPGGRLAVTLWRFDESRRFTQRCLPPTAYPEPLAHVQLEAGGHLLAFGEDSPVPRYCHFPTAEQHAEYLRREGAELIDRYRPQRGDTLNEYLVYRKSPA